MADSLEGLFADIAAKAASSNQPVLAHLCRMAALEAREKVVPLERRSPRLIGIWDWDVASDLNHLDPGCADLFGADTVRAGKGLPNSTYMAAIHPDDLPELSRSLQQALKGGVFEAEYRIVRNNRTKRVFARGFCTLDESNRPERLPGVIMELEDWVDSR